MKTVGIISKPKNPEVRQIVPALTQWLAERKVSMLVDRETAAALDDPSGGLEREELTRRVGLLVVLGGDGTLLAAARAVQESDLPVLAVNLGGLGFLTAVTLPEMYPALEHVFADHYEVDLRRKLLVEVRREAGAEAGEIVGVYHALNDAVLNKASLARILDFDAFVDGEFVCTYKADGLIISSPTGSTAYSLSAGGPIILPGVEAVLITPIASHTLTNRPLVVPRTSVLEVVVKAEHEPVFLTVDGQVGLDIRHRDRVLCRLSPQVLRLVRPPDKSYFDVLRNKLKWGS